MCGEVLQCLEALGKDRSTVKDILDLGAATGVNSVGQGSVKSGVGWGEIQKLDLGKSTGLNSVG